MNKAELEAEYKRLKKEDADLQKCKVCGITGSKRHMDPHHPWGRSGLNMLRFMWVHRHCHNLTHDKPAAARKRGLLVYENQKEKEYHDT